MFNPVSTYRIQFHKDFTFRHLADIIPYLRDLGIKTLYASPIFAAVPGSNHGYDGVDPLTINPEIGTLDELKKISGQLKEAGISWLQDIVPNHMAFHHHNKWLMDLLKNGPESPYRHYFDQSLADETFFKGPIMVPFLGDDLEAVVTNGDLTVVYENEEYFLAYADQRWPLNQQSSANLKPATLKKLNKKSITEIARQQHYRLCSWKETDNLINYRRFFTVNGLICINIQRQEVFDHYHQFIHQLLEEGIFQGLRIDHIDGLYDPEQYLQRLRNLAGEEVYIVVEKILARNEELPAWPIQGATGYEYLAQVNNLFTKNKSEKAFTGFYKQIAGKGRPVPEQVHDKKELILTRHMNGELDNLANFYYALGFGQNQKKATVKAHIAKLLINFPVYRRYSNNWPLIEVDRKTFLDILGKGPLREFFDGDAGGETKQEALLFLQRCMQFSGPLMAKGVEDTLMYTYNRFIAHNEVGDAPDAFGISTDEFHQLMAARQKHWPLALNATSTHDTKRGEDVRMRLNVLTHISDEWLSTVSEWKELNGGMQQNNAPDANDEYFIYQTLIATYPMPGDDASDYPERLNAYLQKMLREAKVNSNWAQPNEDYENGVAYFVSKILDTESPFWKSFAPLHKKVARLAIPLSLAQVTLKLTCPGVPDIYQGCEGWDFSMVDPDNRRPVDYSIRKEFIADQNIKLSNLLDNGFNGQIKTCLVQNLLQLRSQYAMLFEKGDYIPLNVKGKYADGVIAFARHYQEDWILTIACIAPETSLKDTFVILPTNAPSSYQNLLTGAKNTPGSKLELTDLLEDLPVAVLKLEHSQNPRTAGVLLHITSLPSKFGIGDLGPCAQQFADTLKSGGQRYWQILPLNSVSEADAYSPYSATSSRAGNILLISPELLLRDGLLTNTDLLDHKHQSGKVNFKAAQRSKQPLLALAWQKFDTAASPVMHAEFEDFCIAEAAWLDDFAMYSVLKDLHHQSAWHIWPDEYKFRKPQALKILSKQHAAKINYVKWLQYIFARQWGQLKQYCNGLGIKILGDLPFYVSYDSADVWAQPEIFNLDEHLQMLSVSGVPPDYFNEDGQRWGTPVYRWDKLKEQGYPWWINRIQKNLQWYDELRLDHFRAFAAYWDVPADEDTAKNGKWINAPGTDFFEVLKSYFPAMPFVAEDLGEIDEPVYELKDSFGLPGMKVLQFAFGKDVSKSAYAPHNHSPNFIAYTGTHDNNTIVGWFRQDADEITRKNLRRYTGKKPGEDNISGMMIRTALASVCSTAVIPLQDWLGLNENARMNTPAGKRENWTWQLTEQQMNAIPVKQMRRYAMLYGRS